MKPRLCDYLVCPSCKNSFEMEVSESDGDEILEGTLSCSGCDLSYPILRGIPRIYSPEMEEATKRTVRNFGWQWNNLDPALQETEFDSSRVFLDFIEPVEPEFFAGKVVLDAGCGAGRFAMLSQRFGAREVIGIDLSSSVETAFDKTRHLKNVHIVQTDIYDLPFKKDFGFIYSVGVLHHLPDPRKGFISLTNFLRENGAIAFWVYGEENNEWYLKTVDPIRKKLTSKMPSGSLSVLCHLITIVLFPFLKLIYEPVNHYGSLRRLRRFLFYNNYLSYLAKFSYSAIHAVIFDQLTPQIAHYLPKTEIESWFNSSSFKENQISSRNNNSWRGFGDGFVVSDKAGVTP